MQADAESLGSYLRRERERRQVSLQDISAATKVQLRFLEALEQDDYDHLPPAPFVGGFIRAYAQCLALDPEEIIAAYYAHHDVSEGLEGHRLFVAYQVKRAGRWPPAKLALALVVVVLMAGVVWRTLRGGRETSIPPPPLPSQVAGPTPAASPTVAEAPPLAPTRQSMPPAGVSPAPSQKPAGSPARRASEQSPEPAVPLEASSPPPEGGIPASPAAPPPSVEPHTPLVLQAVAMEDTWLRVDIDGDTRHTLLLTAGKKIQWEAADRFVLTIGNAHGTRLRLNGHEIPLPPTRTNVVRDFIVTRALMH